MLVRGREQGDVIIVVLPVSSDYLREFITPQIEQDFEDMLNKLRTIVPGGIVIRLDQLRAFESDDVFSDFVHLNSSGRNIATAAFISQLKGYLKTTESER